MADGAIRLGNNAKDVPLPNINSTLYPITTGIIGTTIWNAETEEGGSKRHTPDQEALSDLAKGGKRGITNADADILIEWADEYDFPARDDRGEPHWDARKGMDHIHLGPKHIPVNN